MSRNKNKIYWLIFVSFLVLGIFLRFYRVRETQNFFYDVTRDMEVVRKLIVDRKLTLLGPQTSFGLHSPIETYFGPLYYYLITPALFLSGLDPIGPAILTALFGVLTAILLFRFLSQATQKKWLSLCGFFIYLISPLIIEYSRFPWNPNFIPFFTVLLLFLMGLFFKKERLLIVFLVGFVSGLIFQLHYVSIGVILAAGICVLMFRPKKFIRNVSTLCFGFISGILPMVLFEFRHQFFLSRSIIKNITSNSGNILLSLGRVIVYLRSLLGRFFGIDDYSLITMEASGSMASLMLTVLFLGLMALSLVKEKRENKNMFLFLTIAFVLGLLSASFYSQFQYQRIEDRYLLPVVPIFLSLVVISIKRVTDLIKNRSSYWKITLLMTVLIFALLSFFSIKRDWQIISRKISIDLYQVNMEGAKKISQIIAEDIRENNLDGKFNVANIVDGNTRATYYRYFLELNQTPAMGVEQYPQAEVLYILSKEDADFVIDYPVWEISSFTPKKIIDQWQGPHGVKIYKLIKE